MPASVDGTGAEQRILEQAVRLPTGGAVTGWAGCRLWGAAFFDGRAPDGQTLLPVPLAVGGGNVRGDSAVRVMRDRLGPDEVVVRFGVPTALPPPLVNRPVFDRRGRLLAIVDLLDPAAGLVGEFDGADHRGARRHSDDVAREDVLRRHGLEVFRVTGPDLARPERVTRRMIEARNRSRWETEVDRRWTVAAPLWWEESPSLDEVLDRRDAVNALHALGDARSAPRREA